MSEDIVIRKAIEKDAPYILNVMRDNMSYYKSSEEGKKEDKEGFILANYSAGQMKAIISKHTVFVCENSKKEITACAIGTVPEANKYEKFKNNKITWENEAAKKAYNSNDYFYLWIIATLRNSAGKGLGRKMTSFIEHVAWDQGYNHILCDLMAKPIQNQRSRGFFIRLGWTPVGILDIMDYHGSGPCSWEIFWLKK